MDYKQTDIKDQKLVYHMTDIKNLDSILKEGIKPRSELICFSDVGEPEILEKRKLLGLDQKVPFHFFTNNPFDGGVAKANPGVSFVILSVLRAHAQTHNWNVIPRHPLASEAISLLSYDDGMNAIDWAVMNSRNYSNRNCKSVCMAECLAPGVVSVDHIFSIYVKTDACEAQANQIVRKYNLSIYINKRVHMFPRNK